VDNAAGDPISGEIGLPAGFNAKPTVSGNARFEQLKPGQRYTAEFDVLAPFPIERHRTFQALVNYRRQDGKEGTTRSYPVTSRTDERIASGWVKRVEASMANWAPPTPWGNLYEEALQKREFVHAAFNSGAYGDCVRLAKEHGDICQKVKKQREQKAATANVE
jgi:hypothetical protein